MNGTATLNSVGRPRLRAAALIAAAVLGMLVAACSGSNSNGPRVAYGGSSTGSGGSAHAGGSSSSASAVAFSACMRAHGVSRFPDPGSDGYLPKLDPRRVGVSGSQFTAAVRACQPLLPNDSGSIERCESAGACPQAVTQRLLTAGLRFARCMRTHGVPGWPDPAADAQGRVAFAISISRDGFDPNSNQIGAKESECEQLLPGGVPLAVSR